MGSSVLMKQICLSLIKCPRTDKIAEIFALDGASNRENQSKAIKEVVVRMFYFPPTGYG